MYVYIYLCVYNIGKNWNKETNGWKDNLSFFLECLFKIHFVVKPHNRL